MVIHEPGQHKNVTYHADGSRTTISTGSFAGTSRHTVKHETAEEANIADCGGPSALKWGGGGVILGLLVGLASGWTLFWIIVFGGGGAQIGVWIDQANYRAEQKQKQK